MRGFRDFFEEFSYPAGEPHVRLKQMPWNEETILAPVYDWNGLNNLYLATEILLRHGIMVKWLVPYFPFARHDRPNNNSDASPLQAAIRFVRSSGMDVICIDPHSDVLAAQISHYTQAQVMAAFGVVSRSAPEVIVIPDAGASKKAYTWTHLFPEAEVIQCEKKRDGRTGALSGFKIHDQLGVITSSHVLIVDDICDGGGTFLGISDELDKLQPSHKELVVTHGLFTKGMDQLNLAFDTIWTLDIYADRGDTRHVPVGNLELTGSIERR